MFRLVVFGTQDFVLKFIKKERKYKNALNAKKCHR